MEPSSPYLEIRKLAAWATWDISRTYRDLNSTRMLSDVSVYEGLKGLRELLAYRQAHPEEGMAINTFDYAFIDITVEDINLLIAAYQEVYPLTDENDPFSVYH